jgi:hypothetical protein
LKQIHAFLSGSIDFVVTICHIGIHVSILFLDPLNLELLRSIFSFFFGRFYRRHMFLFCSKIRFSCWFVKPPKKELSEPICEHIPTPPLECILCKRAKQIIVKPCQHHLCIRCIQGNGDMAEDCVFCKSALPT